MPSQSCNDTVQVLSPRAAFLQGRGANHTSQFGEDGLIAAWLERYPPVNRWCFEVGAADGKRLSNTALLREQGWTAVLIEGDAEQYEKLRELKSPTCITVPKRIDANSLDRILAEHKAPQDIDLGVIDIDGMDYWIWDGLRSFRPRLVLIEFDPDSADEEHIPMNEADGLTSYRAMMRLGNDKGYEAIAKTYCNLLFAAV